MVYICRGCNKPKKEQCECKQLLIKLDEQQQKIQAQQQLIQQLNPKTNHIMPCTQAAGNEFSATKLIKGRDKQNLQQIKHANDFIPNPNLPNKFRGAGANLKPLEYCTK
ncbi:hypothetical protein ACTFIR_012724 [Dictyostelium discoideum]